MMAVSERSISLESIPKDLLLKLQSYRTIKPDCKQSNEDSEVEQCLQNFDLSPPSPKSSISDDVFIKYPTRRSESDEIEEKRPHSSFSNHLLLSPLPDREGYTSRDEQSDVMKSRSPIPPNHRYQQSPFTSIAEQTRAQTGFDRTPIKFHSPSLMRNIEQNSASKESLQTDRSPMRGVPESHYVQRSPVSRLGPMINMEPSSPYPREITDPRVLSPAYYHQPRYREEFPRRATAAKKQLSFDTPYARPCGSQDMDGYEEMGYSPLKGRYRASSDSDIAGAFGDHLDDDDSRLISKFLQHIHKRKRKMSDRYESDYDDDAYLLAKRKRKQLERKMNMNYLKQLEADVSMLNNQLKQPEPRPDNCSCAIMERQFLQMSENAYKNIRRQDTSADGFAQFRKELNETNEILKESLEVMQNMREFCEHKQLLKNLTM